MAATQRIGASGDQRIDGLLAGARWSAPSVTYSFPDARSDYGYPAPGVAALGPDQASALRAILEAGAPGTMPGAGAFSVEGLTGLDLAFLPNGSGAGAIRHANGSAPSTAETYYPAPTESGGDSWYGPSGRDPVVGNYDFYTLLHETGHGLGLKHGSDGGGFGALPEATDSMEYSAMTYRSYVGSDGQFLYNEDGGYAQSFMMYDIAALQHLYGPDFTTNAGDTTYTWRPTSGATVVDGAVAIDPGWNRIFATIWDGGGDDTYDLTAYRDALVVDLAPGACSTFSIDQCAWLGGGPNGGYARGNIFNSLQYRDDPGSLVENAVGGRGNDRISGNEAANLLRGGAGNDDLTGRNGDDTLRGGGGSDRLAGNAGADTLIGGFGDDVFSFGFGSSTAAARDTIAAGDGAAAFQGVGRPGGDLIDLSSLDANFDKGGDQAFVLGGNGKGRLSVTASGTDSLVRGNVDGDDWFEIEFRIADADLSHTAYKATDFIL
jgi:serralysin